MTLSTLKNNAMLFLACWRPFRPPSSPPVSVWRRSSSRFLFLYVAPCPSSLWMWFSSPAFRSSSVLSLSLAHSFYPLLMKEDVRIDFGTTTTDTTPTSPLLSESLPSLFFACNTPSPSPHHHQTEKTTTTTIHPPTLKNLLSLLLPPNRTHLKPQKNPPTLK